MTKDMTRKMMIMKIMTIMTKMTIMKQHDAKVPFAGGGVLRSVLLLLVMMTMGTTVSWADDVPFEVTTNPSAPHYYLIQSFVNTGYYMRPNGTKVNTLNIITDDMKWYFLTAGEPEDDIQYYYICDKNNRYLYFSSPNYVGTGETQRIWVELRESVPSGSEDNYKFTIEKKNSQNWNSYNIIPKGTTNGSGLNKQGGNAGGKSSNAKLGDIQVYAGYNDQSSNWNFIDVDDFEWTLRPECFIVSTEETIHYYKIQNKNFPTHYIMPDMPDATNVKTSNSTSVDDMAWYFKEVGSNGFMKYYYIIHAATGKYLHYGGGTTESTFSSPVLAEHTGLETGEAENRFRFIVARGANGDETITDTKGITFNIVPQLLENAFTNNPYKYYCLSSTNTAGSNLAIENSRSDNKAHWNFESTTFSGAWADPEIACDANGTVTITYEDGATVYYTTEDHVPTTDDNAYDPYSKPTVSDGITTIKARAIAAGKNPSNVVTKTIVLNPTITLTAESYTYDGTAQAPVSSVDVNTTNIASTEYTVSYKKGGVDVPECIDAGTYTIVLTDDEGGDYIVYGTGSFTIGQKSLTVTANDNTITYGDAPAHNEVTYDSFVGADNESVLGGTLSYAYNYTQYGDVSDTDHIYTITPSGLTSTNYNITFVAGTLTVNPKEVGLSWSTPTSFPYDGAAHVLTATVTGMVNGDAIGVTVTTTAKEGSSLTGEDAINAGSYTATASALTGGKAGNYALPAANTADFTIAKIGITPTVTLDGWIYGETAATPTVDGNTGNGAVTYTYKVKDAADDTYTETQPSDAGQYTVKASIAATTNYEAATATTDFTITKATLTASVTLDGWTYGETAATPSVTGNTGNGTVTYTYKVKDADDATYSETKPTDAGTYTVKASIAATTNYEAATTTTDFTIAQKSLGDGVAPAPGIIVNVTKTGDNYTVSVKDNGSDLSTDDYDVMEPGAEDNPMIWTITGKRNYKGGAVVTYETITFWKTKETAPGMQDVATYISKDVNKVTPSGMTAYIVTGINMTKHALKLKPISDIPQNVPVLLLTSLTETDEENEIDFTASPTAGSTSDTDGNQLQVSTGQEVEAGQVYAFYKGKFALTTKGTLKVDKFFLDNPTYTVATPGTPISAAPLRIVFDETTDVEDGIWKMDDGRDDKWYSLDGRRLNGRPIKKGLYIRNGHKVVIK